MCICAFKQSFSHELVLNSNSNSLWNWNRSFFPSGSSWGCWEMNALQIKAKQIFPLWKIITNSKLWKIITDRANRVCSCSHLIVTENKVKRQILQIEITQLTRNSRNGNWNKGKTGKPELSVEIFQSVSSFLVRLLFFKKKSLFWRLTTAKSFQSSLVAF